jgi:hypothetical protein
MTYTDGVDYKTIDYQHPEHGGFDPRNHSIKFDAAGVRYLITSSIYTPTICWISRCYQPGPNTDLVIARKPGEIGSILNHYGEKSFADAIFKDPNFIIPDGTHRPEQRLLRMAQARHEHMNRRMKEFGILSKEFRNEYELHEYVVHAVANIVQLSLWYARPPMDLSYSIERYGQGDRFNPHWHDRARMSNY